MEIQATSLYIFSRGKTTKVLRNLPWKGKDVGMLWVSLSHNIPTQILNTGESQLG
jgi:hypothetical protein